MNTRRIFFTVVAAFLVAVLIVHVTRTPTARAAASQQIIFSGTGVFTDDDAPRPITPFGFWIWCEGASSNPYQGECNGAMYFYAFGITKGVFGSVSGSGHQFNDCPFGGWRNRLHTQKWPDCCLGARKHGDRYLHGAFAGGGHRGQ